MISLGLGIRTRWRRWRHGPPIDQDYVEARAVARLLGQPAAPLARSSAGPDGGLKVAIVVPFFRRGSGGHMTICNLIRGLERRGHACSVWIDDSGRRLSPAAAAPDFRAWFGPFAAPVQYGFDAWDGADVTVATGWQTVARVRQLGGSGTRAYLVQDHEPEFFPTSAQRHWAADSYRHGCYPITAGAWLATLMQEEYGLPATAFDLGVDTARYRPRDVPRRSDVVLFYARSSTPRRAVPLALAALAELRERRPNVELWFFGDGRGPAVDFPYRDVGIVHSDELARLYTGYQVAKFTNLRAAARLKAGGTPGPELSIGKLALTANLTATAEFVAKVLGPRVQADTGEWGTWAWATFICGTPGMRIAGGSDETLRNIIGERVLGLPKEPGIDSKSPFKDILKG